MHARIAALAFALLGLVAGCVDGDPGVPPESCQDMVSQILSDDLGGACHDVLGVDGSIEAPVQQVAVCVSLTLGLEAPSGDNTVGAANKVAYQALCDVHGGDYCAHSAAIGCAF